MLKDGIHPDYDILAMRRQSVNHAAKGRKKKT